MNERLLYFGDGRNNIAFFNHKIPHQIPIKRVVFSDCFEILKPTKSTTATIKTLRHPSRPTDFFYHPNSGWSRDQPRPGSFLQRPREAEKRAWERSWVIMHSPSTSQCLSKTQKSHGATYLITQLNYCLLFKTILKSHCHQQIQIN